MWPLIVFMVIVVLFLQNDYACISSKVIVKNSFLDSLKLIGDQFA